MPVLASAIVPPAPVVSVMSPPAVANCGALAKAPGAVAIVMLPLPPNAPAVAVRVPVPARTATAALALTLMSRSAISWMEPEAERTEPNPVLSPRLMSRPAASWTSPEPRLWIERTNEEDWPPVLISAAAPSVWTTTSPGPRIVLPSVRMFRVPTLASTIASKLSSCACDSSGAVMVVALMK